MDKIAYLEQIKAAAFEDELDKIAAISGGKVVDALKKALGSAKGYASKAYGAAKGYAGESLGATKELPGSILRYIKAIRASGPAKNTALGSMLTNDARQELLRNARLAAPTLAVGGAGAGGLTAGLMLGGDKKKKYR